MFCYGKISVFQKNIFIRLFTHLKKSPTVRMATRSRSLKDKLFGPKNDPRDKIKISNVFNYLTKRMVAEIRKLWIFPSLATKNV